MKKIVIVHGLMAGLIVSGLLLISHPLVDKGVISYDSGTLVGYATMVLALSLVFIGIRSYRDRVLSGVISFGRAVKAGLLITLIASLIYALTWDIYYRVAASDFTKRYTAHYLEKMEKEGASPEEISSMKVEMENFNELYRNTFIRFGITMMEILPVGVVITLLSAAMLRNRKTRRATAVRVAKAQLDCPSSNVIFAFPDTAHDHIERKTGLCSTGILIANAPF